MARAEQAAVADEKPFQSTDLVASAREAVAFMAPLAVAKDVELAFEVEVESAAVRSDPAALHDILINLIDNAIRYNRPGGSVVASVGAEQDRHVVRISDDGPGIAPEHRERVFDRFYRIPATDRPSGSGLGLSIAQALAQQNGGAIALMDGIDGKGLTIVVSFAAAKAALIPPLAQ
jgi:two-component system sensor histidine kinase TctE